MNSSGGFMGLPGCEKKLHMRVVDMYRREGDKLAENWVFIDLLYWMMQQGVDVLDRIRATC
jgi:predicted ester cyclase